MLRFSSPFSYSTPSLLLTSTPIASVSLNTQASTLTALCFQWETSELGWNSHPGTSLTSIPLSLWETMSREYLKFTFLQTTIPVTPIQFNQTRPSSERSGPINCLPPFCKTNFLLSPFHTRTNKLQKLTFSLHLCLYILTLVQSSINSIRTFTKQPYPFKLLYTSLVGWFVLTFNLHLQFPLPTSFQSCTTSQSNSIHQDHCK